MSSEDASNKKIAGHINEYDYAGLIGAEVNPDSGTRKKDVIDRLTRAHSVKAGKKWQIFLYSYERLRTDQIFRGLGVAEEMQACLASLPSTRQEREANLEDAKRALQQPMRNLAAKLASPSTLEPFFLKAMFEAGEVDFLAVLPAVIDQVTVEQEHKHFHLFYGSEAVNTLCDGMKVETSMARQKGGHQVDAQKVLFRQNLHQGTQDSAQQYLNFGEIEVRTDRKNYRRLKMWLDASRTLVFLKNNITAREEVFTNVTCYGKAIRAMRGLKERVSSS